MKRLLSFKTIANMTMAIILVGTIVFIFGFGSTIYLARQEVERQTDLKVNQAIELVQNFVDGQLQRVEDVGYTLLSSKFAGTVRGEDGHGFVTIDPSAFNIPTEEEVFSMLEQFINVNPHICGIAIGFEPGVYPDTKGQYGFAAYVTNVTGKNERLYLGDIHDYRDKEWYKEAAQLNSAYWSRPFAETSMGKVVACYSIPLHGIGNRLIGVLALDINTETFRDKCSAVAPFAGAEVALVDREFNIISHPNQSYILKNISEIDQYKSYQSDDSMRVKMLEHQIGQYLVNKGTDREGMFYFAPIERTGWTISIECPSDEIFKSVEHMKNTTRAIAAISMLFMLLCFGLLFRRIQKITVSKAGIERDLEIASKIQMGMLPKLYPAFPDRKELDVYGFLKPAKTVGGDLYDYFIRDEKFYFCIGDVSGKGVPASLFMAVIRALFRNISLHVEDPSEIISSLNKALSQGNTHNMFCTMFLGVLDLKNGHLDYCNAGHNSPVIRRLRPDGSVNVYYAQPETNLALGVIEEFVYKKGQTTLSPGEAIFLYTDGVTEAEDHNKKMFGEDATLKALSTARARHATTAKDFVDDVYRTVTEFAQGAEQSDDITMLVVEYKGEPSDEALSSSLHLKNNINEIPSLSDWINHIAEKEGLDEEKVFSLNLALEEAVVNVMNYAYPGQEDMPVNLSYSREGDHLTFVLDDHGIAFDPTQAKDPDITLSADERPIGGLGILLVKRIMDSVSYERRGEHNILTMKMKHKK